jgi:hypothetical protein
LPFEIFVLMSRPQSKSTQEDVEMNEGSSAFDSLLRLEEIDSCNAFLVKMPQWIADYISSSASGTEIGFSQDLMGYLSPEASDSPKEELRLVVSSSRKSKVATSQVSEYGISVPSLSECRLRVFETRGSSTLSTRVRSTLHLIPKRDEMYAEVLRDRMNASDVSKQHRTLHNEEDYSTSRTAVKLFQRPESLLESASRAAELPGSARASKRVRGLDEMPQRESREAFSSGSSPKSLDDALMETLVHKDEGWPLQLLSRALKEKGVSAPMAQLKAKLLEICVYQRRGEDTHPRYYLKSEYK